LLIAFVLVVLFTNIRRSQDLHNKPMHIEVIPASSRESIAVGVDTLTNSQAFVAVLTLDTYAMSKFNPDQLMVCIILLVFEAYAVVSFVTGFVLKLIDTSTRGIASIIHGHLPSKK
jgi:hypothetical protein